MKRKHHKCCELLYLQLAIQEASLKTLKELVNNLEMVHSVTFNLNPLEQSIVVLQEQIETLDKEI